MWVSKLISHLKFFSPQDPIWERWSFKLILLGTFTQGFQCELNFFGNKYECFNPGWDMGIESPSMNAFTRQLQMHLQWGLRHSSWFEFLIVLWLAQSKCRLNLYPYHNSHHEMRIENPYVYVPDNLLIAILAAFKFGLSSIFRFQPTK